MKGRILVYPTAGNHEIFGDGDLTNYIKHAKPPGGEIYYYTRYKNAGFMSLKSYDSKMVPRIDSKQMQWIENTLSENRSSVDALFVFLHHPLLTRFQYAHREPVKNTDEVRALLRKWDVTAVFMGHEHSSYDHMEERGVHYFITGGGGAPLSKKNKNAFHHYLLVEINDGQVKITAVDMEGIARDEVLVNLEKQIPEK